MICTFVIECIHLYSIQYKPFLSLNTVTKRTVFCAYVNLSLLQNLLVSALCHGQTHVHLPTLMALTELTKLLFSSVAFFKFEYNQTPMDYQLLIFLRYMLPALPCSVCQHLAVLFNVELDTLYGTLRMGDAEIQF